MGRFGFIQATRGGTDASWLAPVGATLDWALTDREALTAAFLLNFTNLETDPYGTACAMPALLVAILF